MTFFLTNKGRQYLSRTETLYTDEVPIGSKSWYENDILVTLEDRGRDFKALLDELGFDNRTLAIHLDDLETRGYVKSEGL